MTRRLLAAVLLAVLLLLAGYALGRAATPRPAQVIPESAFGPVSLGVDGEVPSRDSDPGRTGSPHATASATARSDPSPEPAGSPPLAGSGGFFKDAMSWYGPGLYGHRTACGQTLTPALVGVASRTLRCGTLIEFRWAGRIVTAPVVDYGPAAWTGRTWDLTSGLCRALDHCYTGPIEWRLA